MVVSVMHSTIIVNCQLSSVNSHNFGGAYMSLVKYRIRDVATDFGVAPKEIVEIISKYFEKPKSNTQVMTEEELNVVFDVMTQTHQIASLEQVFAVQPKAEAPKTEAPKAEAPKASQADKPAQPKPQNNHSEVE